MIALHQVAEVALHKETETLEGAPQRMKEIENDLDPLETTTITVSSTAQIVGHTLMTLNPALIAATGTTIVGIAKVTAGAVVQSQVSLIGGASASTTGTAIDTPRHPHQTEVVGKENLS